MKKLFLYILLSLSFNVSVAQDYELLNLLRQQQIVEVPTLDEDVEDFITIASISDETIINALQYLVTELKDEGLWDNYIAIYPIVGGTATTHKYNLKDPQDTNGAFRLTFNGTITHNANGMEGNGTNGFANTHIVSTTHLAQNDVHISFYSATSGADDGIEMGTYSWGTENALFINMRSSDDQDYSVANATGWISRAWTAVTGLYVVNRTESTEFELLRGGTITTITATSVARDNLDIYLLAANTTDGTLYNGRLCQFASVGTGFSDAELAIFNTIVNTYQSMLGR